MRKEWDEKSDFFENLENSGEPELSGETKNSEEFLEFQQYEEAYLNLKKQDTPDLWDRIEAGIEKERKETISATETVERKPESEENVISINEKSKRFSNMKKYFGICSALAAAVLLCFVVLPVVTAGLESSDSKMMSDSSNGVAVMEDDQTLDYSKESSEDSDAAVMEETTEDTEQNTEESGRTYFDKGYAQNSMEDTEDAVVENIQLIKAEEVSEADLKKIDFSDLSPNSRQQLKELGKKYVSCTFYVDKSEKIYVKDENVLYVVEGASVTVR